MSTKITINNNGSIVINNMSVGIYNFDITYENNNYFEIIKFIINIKPKAFYDNLELQYSNHIILPTFTYPKNGLFNFLTYHKNIKYLNNGTIKILKAIPNNYKINYNYIFNKSIYNGIFYLQIKPIIIMNVNKIISKYQNEYINRTLTANPYGGIFSSNYSDLFLNYYYFEISKDKIVGNYDIELYYTKNDQRSIFKIELIIEPEIYYSNNNIILTYYDNIKSVKPFINPYGGIFYLIDDINGISIDSNTGILTFYNINIGKYKIIIYYKYNDIVSNTYFNIESN